MLKSHLRHNRRRDRCRSLRRNAEHFRAGRSPRIGPGHQSGPCRHPRRSPASARRMAWPYFEASCLRDTRNPFGKAREVRIVSTDRLTSVAGSTRRPLSAPAFTPSPRTFHPAECALRASRQQKAPAGMIVLNRQLRQLHLQPGPLLRGPRGGGARAPQRQDFDRRRSSPPTPTPLCFRPAPARPRRPASAST